MFSYKVETNGIFFTSFNLEFELFYEQWKGDSVFSGYVIFFPGPEVFDPP